MTELLIMLRETGTVRPEELLARTPQRLPSARIFEPPSASPALPPLNAASARPSFAPTHTTTSSRSSLWPVHPTSARASFAPVRGASGTVTAGDARVARDDASGSNVSSTAAPPAVARASGATHGVTSGATISATTRTTRAPNIASSATNGASSADYNLVTEASAFPPLPVSPSQRRASAASSAGTTAWPARGAAQPSRPSVRPLPSPRAAPRLSLTHLSLSDTDSRSGRKPQGGPYPAPAAIAAELQRLDSLATAADEDGRGDARWIDFDGALSEMHRAGPEYTDHMSSLALHDSSAPSAQRDYSLTLAELIETEPQPQPPSPVSRDANVDVGGMPGQDAGKARPASTTADDNSNRADRSAYDTRESASGGAGAVRLTEPTGAVTSVNTATTVVEVARPLVRRGSVVPGAARWRRSSSVRQGSVSGSVSGSVLASISDSLAAPLSARLSAPSASGGTSSSASPAAPASLDTAQTRARAMQRRPGEGWQPTYGIGATDSSLSFAVA